MEEDEIITFLILYVEFLTKKQKTIYVLNF
jgi:hypothetical protein